MNIPKLSRKGRAVRNTLAGLACLFLLWAKLDYPLPLSPDFQRAVRESQLEPCAVSYISQRSDDGWGLERQTAVGRTDRGLIAAVFREGSWLRRFWDEEPLTFQPFTEHLACIPSPTEPGVLYLATDLDAAERAVCSLSITRLSSGGNTEPPWQYTAEGKALGSGVFRLQLKRLTPEGSIASGTESVVWAELCSIFDPSYSHMRCEMQVTLWDSAGEPGTFGLVLETPDSSAVT